MSPHASSRTHEDDKMPCSYDRRQRKTVMTVTLVPREDLFQKESSSDKEVPVSGDCTFTDVHAI